MPNTWSATTLSYGREKLAAAAAGTKVLFGGGQGGSSYLHLHYRYLRYCGKHLDRSCLGLEVILRRRQQ